MRKSFLLAVSVLLTNVMCSQQQGFFSSRHANEQGFVALFDGKSLAGWQYGLDDYTVEDGKLICKKGAHKALYTDGQYSDFILRLEYRLEAGSNNGISIRTTLSDLSPRFVGVEVQILDDSFGEYQNLEPAQFNGSIYAIAAAKRGHMKPVGEWNAMEIIAKGSRIQVLLNGTQITDVDMDTVGPLHLYGHDFVGLHNKTGHIALCSHGDRVEFRNIRVKDL